jgi:hypothetical protein
MVRGYAWQLWRNEDGMENGIQEAILYALTRKAWFDPAKGKLGTWLAMALKTVRQAERSKGHRRGTVAEPRVVCLGEGATPVAVDRCDPESILIAIEASKSKKLQRAAERQERNARRMTPDQVAYIRANPDKSDWQLAKELGFNHKSIYRIRKGKHHAVPA